MDRNHYEKLEFRAAFHPSESLPFFTARILAFCLNAREGLEFSPGISAPEEPAIRAFGPTGNMDLWIDIGNPAAKRIHKAAKAVKEVLIYTHKDVRLLAKEFSEEKVHRLSEIEIYPLDSGFLGALGGVLERDNRFEITRNDGELYVGAGKKSFQTKVERYLFAGETL